MSGIKSILLVIRNDTKKKRKGGEGKFIVQLVEVQHDNFQNYASKYP